MLVLPIQTDILKKGDDLASEILANVRIESGDILVISSKAIATVEGTHIALGTIEPSVEARKLSKACNQNPKFTQAVLSETERMNGRIEGTCPFALLTSLKPRGMKTGRILCPNAGLDQSNVGEGYVIGWPLNPVQSAIRLREELFEKIPKKPMKPRKKTLESLDSSLHLAIIISDSCCIPMRLGVTAFALVCAGIDPLRCEIGMKDLFGKGMRVTHEAIADQLATAANAVMGNTSQCTPAAIIRNFGLPSSNFCGWVEGIEPEEDIFLPYLKPLHSVRRQQNQ